MTCWTSYMG